MVFKRRDKRSIAQIVLHSLYPRGGWGRALYYITHRVRRLPDTPHKIARGVFVGVFTTFTPFYGLHFILAALMARMVRGNILAALLATLFGNPLTYVPIGMVSLSTGHFLLGSELDAEADTTLIRKFAAAGADLKDNFVALFTDAQPDWAGLALFYHEVFLPYLIGGILPGLVAGFVGYHVTLPVIAAYQNRRRGRLKQKLAGLGKSGVAKADEPAGTP